MCALGVPADCANRVAANASNTVVSNILLIAIIGLGWQKGIKKPWPLAKVNYKILFLKTK
jgi:hypothetical protein